MTRACLLVLLFFALGGDRADAADLVYPPGSRLGLVPPAGMTTSTNFFGFEDPNTNAAIILVSLPVQAYAELERSVSADVLKREGVTLEKRETISLSTGKAFLVIGRQEIDKTKVRKWILIGASSNLTALVAILSDAAPNATAPARSQILVTVGPGGPAQTSERETFARDAFAAISNIRDVRVITSEPLRILGQPGHQILAQARDASGATALTVVQWLRFGGGGYLQIVALAPVETWSDAYPRFRAVRDGIEPR